jgi:hypothetical protein
MYPDAASAGDPILYYRSRLAGVSAGGVSAKERGSLPALDPFAPRGLAAPGPGGLRVPGTPAYFPLALHHHPSEFPVATTLPLEPQVLMEIGAKYKQDVVGPSLAAKE